MLTKTGAYDNWNDLNPQDFAYSLDLNADMTPYEALLTGPDRVFIDNYAMTFPAEDRARIFECACTSGNEEDFVSPILQAKLQRICTGIRQAFDLEDAPGALPVGAVPDIGTIAFAAQIARHGIRAAFCAALCKKCACIWGKTVIK